MIAIVVVNNNTKTNKFERIRIKVATKTPGNSQ